MHVTTVAIGADHAGVQLKQLISKRIKGYAVVDCGAHDDYPTDYPDFARSVGHLILSNQAERGILICGSGVGAAIAANKIHGIRAALCHDTYSALQAVEHDNANLLCLGAKVIGPALAEAVIRVFLEATFSDEPRHVRRLEKIAQIEREGK